MTIRRTIRAVACAVAVLGVTFPGAVCAQQRSAPTPTALLMAKQIIDLKGATSTFDPLIRGVIEFHKNLLIQTNPNLSNDINQVAAKLENEMQGRKSELQQQLARTYAEHFSEQELRDALAFYRTPLGKKLIAEEPKALEEAMKMADDWSRNFADEVAAKLRAELKKRGLNVI
jgi:hypothetical protein